MLLPGPGFSRPLKTRPAMIDPSDKHSVLRLLVLAPNWLGDVVMTTPLLSFLHANRGAVSKGFGRPFTLCLGIRGAWAGLFRDDDRIDELMVIERGGRHGGFGGVFRLADTLRQGGFDAVIIGPPSLRSGLAAKLSGISDRVGYRSDGRSLLLNHGVAPQRRGSIHYSREMIHLGRVWLESLGLVPGKIQDRDWTSSLPGCESLPPANSGEGGPVWAVAPGTTYGEAKTWPVARLAEFIRLAVDRHGVRFVFLGDGTARGFTTRLKEQITGEWGDEPQSNCTLLDLTGKTDLTAAVRVLKASQAFVGNDSGLMHLAAALGMPTIGVFGSSNPDWTAPLGQKTRAVVPDGFSCRPCYRKTCNQPIFCLDTVSADTVLSEVLKLVGDDLNGREGA